MYKRWYDVDPTLSLSVSLMRDASEDAQLKCAELIVSYAKERGVVLASKSLDDAFSYLLKRWYDKDKQIAEAFEFLEIAPIEIQKEIALEVIGLLQVHGI